MKKRFSEEQIIGFLREADARMAMKDLSRKRGFSEASFYLWRSKFGGIEVTDAKRLKTLGARQGSCRLCHAWIDRLSRSVFAMLTTVSVVGLSATVRIGDQFRVSLDHRDGLSVFARWYTA